MHKLESWIGTGENPVQPGGRRQTSSGRAP